MTTYLSEAIPSEIDRGSLFTVVSLNPGAQQLGDNLDASKTDLLRQATNIFNQQTDDGVGDQRRELALDIARVNHSCVPNARLI